MLTVPPDGAESAAVIVRKFEFTAELVPPAFTAATAQYIS